jgi:hypothetical protein
MPVLLDSTAMRLYGGQVSTIFSNAKVLLRRQPAVLQNIASLSQSAIKHKPPNVIATQVRVR